MSLAKRCTDSLAQDGKELARMALSGLIARNASLYLAADRISWWTKKLMDKKRIITQPDWLLFLSKRFDGFSFFFFYFLREDLLRENLQIWEGLSRSESELLTNF